MLQWYIFGKIFGFSPAFFLVNFDFFVTNFGFPGINFGFCKMYSAEKK